MTPLYDPDDHGEAMTTPTLYYSPGTCSLACQVVAEWTARPYALCRVERAVRSGPLYLAINPAGKVPALATGHGVLTEANAILLHLGRRNPDAPEVAAAWADPDALEYWLSYLASAFHAAFFPYYNPQRYHPDPAQHDAVKAAAVVQIRKELGHVEAALQTRPWVLPQRSLLDPYLFAMSRWARSMFDLPREFEAIARHQAALEADPAVAASLAIERGEPAAAMHLTTHDVLA